MRDDTWYEKCEPCDGKGVQHDGHEMTICPECDGRCYVEHSC